MNSVKITIMYWDSGFRRVWRGISLQGIMLEYSMIRPFHSMTFYLYSACNMTDRGGHKCQTQREVKSRSAQEPFNQCTYKQWALPAHSKTDWGPGRGAQAGPGDSHGHHQEPGRLVLVKPGSQPAMGQGPWDWRTGRVWDTTGVETWDLRLETWDLRLETWDLRLETSYRENPTHKRTINEQIKQRSDTEGAVSYSYKALTSGVKLNDQCQSTNHKQDILIK